VGCPKLFLAQLSHVAIIGIPGEILEVFTVLSVCNEVARKQGEWLNEFYQHDGSLPPACPVK
jgi:hypothetical protein